MSAKKRIIVMMLLGAAFSFSAPRVQAQGCQDERGMADAMVKDVSDLVGTVKKETQGDFESKFHQKSCLNKLTFAIGAIGEAVGCLDKDTSDPTATAAKQNESKLKDKLTEYKTSLKAADDSKAAKQLISTFDLATGEVTAASK